MTDLGKGLFLLAMFCTAAAAVSAADLRPPAVPLVACDPYFSIWSPADRLTDKNTVHWTGKPHRLACLVRIDGKPFRVMGSDPENVPPMKQTSLAVLPTRTLYAFEAEGVSLQLTFLSPALPEEIALLARPVTYLVYDLAATDGQRHRVELYLDAGGELAVNDMGQTVRGTIEDHGALRAVRIGSTEQTVLAKKGDDIRIDWGYLYLAVRAGDRPELALGRRDSLQKGFSESGRRG